MGDTAPLLELAGLPEVLAVAAAAATLPEVLDVVAGAQTVVVHARPKVELGRLAAALNELELSPLPKDAAGETVEIPTVYDGPDLREVAERTGLGVAEVVEAHIAQPWRVGFVGFAPGFAYLVDGDPRLQVPRRAEPRTRVPAGSVGLAGEYSGVYPRESPGGWQLIGHTDAVLWDLRRRPPALLQPGAIVRCVQVSG